MTTVHIVPLNMVLLGPPGSGKSTIAEALIDHHNLVTISTGQLLRNEIRSRTALGRSVSAYIDEGNLAPDSLMDRVLRSSLETLDAEQGILLDGYPRTMQQARGLGLTLADHDRELDLVVALEVNDDEVVRRLSGRRICEGAGDPFSIHIDDLASMMRCRERGGRAIQREDDRPEVVSQRLSVYHEQTQPLMYFYEQASLLQRVDGSGSPAVVSRRVLQLLSDYKKTGT